MADAKIFLTAVDNTKAAIDSVKTNLGSLKATAAAVTGALAAIGATAYLADLAAGVRHAVDEFDELGKSAQRAGFQSAQSMAEFQYAAKLAGVDAQGFETAIGKLSEKMADAAGGSKQATAIFQTMGIRIKDASGQLRNTEDVVADLAAAFSGWKDGPEKSALALELFGKQGKLLIPLLNGGASGLEQLRAEFRALRGVVSGDATKAAEQFNDNLSRMETASQRLKVEIAQQLLPGLVQITDVMVEQAKKGSTLLAVWAGLAEFGKIALNADETGKKITGAADAGTQLRTTGARLDLLLSAQANGGDSAELRAEIVKVRGELEKLQAAALGATHALKGTLNPDYDKQGGTGDFTRLDRTAKTVAPTVNKAGEAKESAYAAVNKQISERIALQQQELDAGRELTDIEKLESKLLEDLRLSKVKVTDAEREDIKAKIEQAKQTDLALKVRKSEFDQAMEIAKERQRLTREGYDEAKRAEQAENDRSHAAAQTLKDIEFETSLLTMNNQQRDVAVALRDLERQGITQGTKAYETYAAAIQEAMGKRAALQESIDNFKTVFESVDRTAHDVFVNIFEGGKSAFTRLRDTLKATLLDLLYQMTVKPWVINIVAGMTGTPLAAAQAASGLTGGTGIIGALGNLGGLGGTLGSLSSGGGIIGSIGSALGLGGGVGGSFASTVGAGLATDALGATVAEGAAAATLGGGVTGALAAIPGWGWAIAGAAALASIFSKKKGGPKQDAVYGLINSGIGLGQRSGDADAAARVAAGGIQQQYDSLVRALGGTGGLQFGLGYSMDPKGTSPTFVDVTASRGGVVDFASLNRDAGRSQEELQTAIGNMGAAAILKGLQESDLAGQIGDWLKSLGNIDSLSGGEMQAALTRINNYATQKAALDERIFQATATDQEKLTRARDQERAAIDETLRPLLEQIYAQEDLKASAQKAADALKEQTAALQQMVDTAYGAYMQSLQDSSDQLRATGEALRDTIALERQRADTLKAYLHELNVGAPAKLTPQAQYEITKAEFDRLSALSPNSDERKDKIQQAAEEFRVASEALYASGTAYFNDLSTIKQVVSASQVAAQVGQFTNEQLYAVNQQQLAALAGINNNTLGTVQALQNLTAAVAGAYAKGAGSAVSGAALKTVLTQGNAAPLNEGQWNSTPLGNVYESTGGALAYVGEGGLTIRGTDNTEFLASAAQQFIANNAGNIDAIRAAAAAKGISDEDVRRLAAGAGISLPGYAVGTWHVPETGPAILHEGEMVLPRVLSSRVRADLASGGGNSDDRLRQEVVGLREQVARLTLVLQEYAQRDLVNSGRLVENTGASRQAAFLMATQP